MFDIWRMEASLTLSELLAEAIGAPEPGALNFTALQELLRRIIRKVDVENETVDQSQTEAPQDDPVTEQAKDAGELRMVSVEQIVESEPYRKLLASVGELREVVEQLKGQVLEQKRISDVVLPTVDQLERFQSERSSTLRPAAGSAPDFLSLATRLDTIDETIGRLTALANDTVLEYSRLEKSLLPFLDGGELAVMRGQLDSINQLLKVHFPGHRSHCSSISALRPSQPSMGDEVTPVDFYQHPAPDSIKPRTSRRGTIKHQPAPDVGKELDTIRAVLAGLIARLPLPESASDTSLAASSRSLELAANDIRSVLPREIEELLHYNDERLETLEGAHAKLTQQVDEVEARATSLGETVDRLSVGWESGRESIDERMRALQEAFENKLGHLGERCSREQLVASARLNELEQEVEMRVDFEHFRTRLPRETFDRTVEELQRQMDSRVEQFMDELRLIWAQLEETSAGVQAKCDRDALERLESRLRRRLTYTQLLVKNLQGTIRRNVEAAGTKVQLGPDTLRCVSCNHEATMQALAELVPTGKAFRAVEKEREQQIKQLNQLASQIASEQRASETADAGKPEKKSTAKAHMVQPKELAYKIHMKKL